MASEKPSLVLLDAVKAQASKLRETKNALDARQKELDALRAELDTRSAALESQAARLRPGPEKSAQEREQSAPPRPAWVKTSGGRRREGVKPPAHERD